MQFLFIVNLLLALLWSVLTATSAPDDYVIGFLIGFVILSLYEPDYGRRGRRLLYFSVYVLWEVVVSSLSLAWYVVQPQLRFVPGIVAVPLDVHGALEITALASAITLTPGTLSVDLGTDDQGRRVLFVHSLFAENPDALRTKIKGGFERQIRLISQRESDVHHASI